MNTEQQYRQLSGILRLQQTIAGDQLQFWCPGCDEEHAVTLAGSIGAKSGWTWNGDPDNPTFYPSIATGGFQTAKDENGRWTGEWVRDKDGKGVHVNCHSYVENGHIRFLNDCTHALKDMTVPLPEWYTHETDGLPGRPPKP